MEKGVFTIYGPDLDRLSVNALISKYEEEFVGSDQHLGCGYEGCDVNLDESLERASRGMIQCFRCTPGDEPVNIEESCTKHEDTTPVLLVLQALREVASWYKKQARTVQLKGTPLIFTNELGGEIYPLTTNDALLLHPAIKAKKKSLIQAVLQGSLSPQAGRLLSLLTGNLVAGTSEGKPQAVSHQKKSNVLRLQRLRNIISENRRVQGQVSNKKRKCVYQHLDVPLFKRRKLDLGVGVRRPHDATREKHESDAAGLLSTFPDILYDQKVEKLNFSTPTQEKFLTEATNEVFDCISTRTWDAEGECTICPTKHSIVSTRQGYLAIYLADQHAPAAIPATGGTCIPVCRYSDATLFDIMVHILWVVVSALQSRQVWPGHPSAYLFRHIYDCESVRWLY